jgi:thioredoxin-related protein
MSTTILSLVLATQFSVVATVPSWNSDYARAVDVARRQQRPLVVVLEDQSQRQETASILANPAVRMTLRECSVCRLDVRTRRGAAVAERLNATTFPYTVISDRTGRKIVFRGSADLSRDEWLQLLDDVMGEQGRGDRELNSRLLAGRAPEPTGRSEQKDDLRVVVVGTNGCAYCERLKIETIPHPTVGQMLDRGMKLEYDNASEDDTLAREHGVTVYPSILVLNQNGTLVDRIDGFVGPTELVARLQACNAQR